MSVNDTFFSNTLPDLISSKSLNDLNEAIIVSDTGKQMSTLADSSLNFYKKFIQPNVIPIIILIAFLSFMVYRYMTKKQEIPEEIDLHDSKNININSDKMININNTDKVIELDNVIDNIIKKNEIDEILDDDSIYDYEDLNKNNENDINIEINKIIKESKKNKSKKLKQKYEDDNFIELENDDMLDYSIRQNKSKIDEVSSLIFS